MASTAKRLYEELSRSGPHEVLRGDLGLVGLPGLVYTPSAGLGLPAVVFGHGFLQPSIRYRALLRHLATWGIVAASPATHRGPLASHRLYAADLRSTLDMVTKMRLGDGEISVDPGKLGLSGHSTGGGCAVLAASQDERVHAVATLAVAETRPPATEAARLCTMPGMHLVGERDLIAPAAGHAEALTEAWAGPVQLRTVPKATHLGFVEGRHWSDLLLHGKAERRTQFTSRALLTAFFLVHVAGQDKYRPLIEDDVKKAELTYQRAAKP